MDYVSEELCSELDGNLRRHLSSLNLKNQYVKCSMLGYFKRLNVKDRY